MRTPMTADERREKDLDLQSVDRAVACLSERFDSVQVFVTAKRGRFGEINVSAGSGSFFSRLGYVRTWLQAEEAKQIRRMMTSGDEHTDDDDDKSGPQPAASI